MLRKYISKEKSKSISLIFSSTVIASLASAFQFLRKFTVLSTDTKLSVNSSDTCLFGTAQRRLFKIFTYLFHKGIRNLNYTAIIHDNLLG